MPKSTVGRANLSFWGVMVSKKTHLNKEKRDESDPESLLAASFRNHLASSSGGKMIREKLYSDILKKGEKEK